MVYPEGVVIAKFEQVVIGLEKSFGWFGIRNSFCIKLVRLFDFNFIKIKPGPVIQQHKVHIIQRLYMPAQQSCSIRLFLVIGSFEREPQYPREIYFIYDL